jgi:hypothetical protein
LVLEKKYKGSQAKLNSEQPLDNTQRLNASPVPKSPISSRKESSQATKKIFISDQYNYNKPTLVEKNTRIRDNFIKEVATEDTPAQSHDKEDHINDNDTAYLNDSPIRYSP